MRFTLAPAAFALYLATMPTVSAADPQDGTYRIMTVGNMRNWTEDKKGMVVTTGDAFDDTTRFVLKKQPDNSFTIEVKASKLLLHEDGGGDKLLSTRYQPNDEFTRFRFEQQNDLSWRIKVVANKRYLRDKEDKEGGTLGTNVEKDDVFSRFVLLQPDCKPHDKVKVKLVNMSNGPIEVFRITRNGDEVRHEQGVLLRTDETAEHELNVGFRWVLRDTRTKEELGRLLTDRKDSFAVVIGRPKKPDPKPDLKAGHVLVPDIDSWFKVDAENVLLRAGLRPVAIPGSATDMPVFLGRAYEQSVAKGQQVPTGTTVQFRYNTWKQPVGVARVRVPWVLNMSRWDAERRLMMAGLAPVGTADTETTLPQRFDIVSGQSPKGHQGDGDPSYLEPGKVVTYRYRFRAGNFPVGPYDVSSPNPIPNLIPLATPDDSLDIAWTRRDGRSFYSKFTGENWSKASHKIIDPALRCLGGMTRDESGNTYLATTAMEYLWAVEQDGKTYRPNVAKLLKLSPASPLQEFETFADLNRQGFSPPIFNPQNMDSALFHTSRLAYGKNGVAFAFGMNNAGGHSTSNILAVRTDRKEAASLYAGGGSQHTADVRLIHDGTDFVMAQAFEAGIGLSKLSEGGTKWSDQILAFRNEWKNTTGASGHTRIGGIAKTDDGYLLLVAHAKGSMGNYNPRDWHLDEDMPLYAVKVPTKFEGLAKFDWVKPQYKIPDGQGRFAAQNLGQPPKDRALIRPNLVDLKDGTYLVLAEQWNWRTPAYEGTYVARIDANGVRRGNWHLIGNHRLHASNDAFRMPKSGQVAWVSGDATNNKLVLNLLNPAQLTVHTVSLSLP